MLDFCLFIFIFPYFPYSPFVCVVGYTMADKRSKKVWPRGPTMERLTSGQQERDGEAYLWLLALSMRSAKHILLQELPLTTRAAPDLQVQNPKYKSKTPKYKSQTPIYKSKTLIYKSKTPI